MSTSVTVIDPTRESEFFKQLDFVQERITLVKTLTRDVLRLEAARGRAALELGAKLKQVREALGTEGGEKSPWSLWCQTFTYTQDYAHRMIAMVEAFGDMEPEVMDLSLQHLREIARFSDAQADRLRMIEIAREHKIGSKQLRYLVSEAKSGKIDLDELVAQHPDVQAELDRRIKLAREQVRAEADEKVTMLEADLVEMDEQNKDLCNQIAASNTKLDKLLVDLKTREAAVKLGGGDPEIGKLKIEVEQATQQRDNLQLTLNEVQKRLQQSQHEQDRFVNSPTGQAKVDLGRVMGDITKFFKDTLTPAYLAMRVHGVGTPEARDEVFKVIDAIEKWSVDAREALLRAPEPLPDPEEDPEDE